MLLVTYLLMGKGLGASGASFRVGVAVTNAIAPLHVAHTPGLAAVTAEGNPLDDWLVFEVVGVLIGGFIAAMTSGRLGRETLRGPTFGTAPRLALGFGGGCSWVAAAKMARGCTSGQALSGGAMHSVGSLGLHALGLRGWIRVAYVVRRQWR